MRSHDEIGAERAQIGTLIGQAWHNAARAAVPAAPWLALLSLTGGFYLWAHTTGTGGTLMTLAAVTLVFLTGVQASLTIYRTLIPDAKGGFMALARTNLAIYLAFFFIGFFVLFFVGAFGVMMLQMSGVVDLSAEGAQADTEGTLESLLATPYGWVLALVFVVGMAGLCFVALRLLLAGAATVQTGRVLVFRTWGWTRGWAVRFGLAAIFTHLAPFLAGLFANIAIIHAIGQSELALFLSGVTGFALQAPFLLTGHGLAVAGLPPRTDAGDIA